MRDERIEDGGKSFSLVCRHQIGVTRSYFKGRQTDLKFSHSTGCACLLENIASLNYLSASSFASLITCCLDKLIARSLYDVSAVSVPTPSAENVPITGRKKLGGRNDECLHCNIDISVREYEVM